ncbi:DUF2812 domain-containing protein [Clostridium manihotivorum]|uniref:DUF2812 domain-containing protein n=1 Tax=Clostridium manihotivorum TaxID=2320868 RepID=A0A410DNH2_9CLOT|nr:DUF2812 domain-containing protein [Clostridium manihotivorum]QAA30610.1 hypothetical protein C1I91_02425 [Clostridium manihotivorum]
MESEDKFIRKFKLFFIWQHEDEEKWLREMSLNGYELVSARVCRFKFRVCEPKDVVYKLDYRRLKKYDKDNYLDIFEESGWQFVTTCMNWIYFKSEAISNEEMDIFNDIDSKAEMLRTIQKALALVSVGELLCFTSVFLNPVKSVYLYVFWALIIGLFIYGNTKMFFKYRELKKKL